MDKLKEDIRNTVREELSKVLATTCATTAETVVTQGTPSTSTSNFESNGSSSTLSFRDFYRIREESRQEDFKPTKKKFKRDNNKPSSSKTMKCKQPKDVEIKVGLAYVNDGIFKARRNKTHLLKVRNDIDKDELIKVATQKHTNFDQSFDSVSPYVLLYPDFSEVYFVPGTEDKFSLVKYREAIGKDYKRLIFYLCLRDEFEYNQFSDISSPVESDHDNDDQQDEKIETEKVNEQCIVVRDDDEDPWLLYAIEQSNQEAESGVAETKKNTLQEPSTLKEALQLTLGSIPDDKYTVIEITRNHLVERSFEQLSGENINGRVIVKFIGEDAVDTGGVTREYFSDLFKGMLDSNDMFRGTFPNLTFRHNMHSLAEGKFELFGKLVAIALLNGCPGPHFLCRSLVSFILDNPIDVSLNEVPDECEFKTKLLEIEKCHTETEFSHLNSNFLQRFDMGYTKPVLTLRDKDLLIKSCSKHIVISSVAEEIFSFRKGLDALGVLVDLCKFPEASVAELVYQDVSVDDVKACFKPEFSDVGSDEHCKETEIIYKWNQFLKKAKNGKLNSEVLAHPIWSELGDKQQVEDQMEVKTLSLGDILQFGSGSRFPSFKGHLEFNHSCNSNYQRLVGNTCALTISIPVNNRYTKCNTDQFAINVMEDLFQDYGFGQK